MEFCGWGYSIMIDRNNFIGLSGFVWWVGVIEDISDPLAIGRCRVRIFGWYSDNTVEVPTKSLPWAHPMRAMNNPKHYTAPNIGDWVVGFFMDGEAAQFPIMMGVLPSLDDRVY